MTRPVAPEDHPLTQPQFADPTRRRKTRTASRAPPGPPPHPAPPPAPVPRPAEAPKAPTGAPSPPGPTATPSPAAVGAAPTPSRDRGAYPATCSLVQSFMKDTISSASGRVLAARWLTAAVVR